MDNNIPIILLGGLGLAVAVYFVTKSKSATQLAKEEREAAIRKGGPSLITVKLPDPPLQGSLVAEGFTIERRGDWSKENPTFILSGTGSVFTDFDHRVPFRAPANHPLWGSTVCPSGCVLYKPGQNPNAPYPSEFVETSQGIASILSSLGKGVTDAFKVQSQSDIAKLKLKSGIPLTSSQPQVIMQPQSNTPLIIVIIVGAILIGATYYMMNQGVEAKK